MSPQDAMHLLDRLRVLSHPCDLDLLIFFAKHPRCLLTSESLAAYLGYEARVIADSLDSLLAAGLLVRTQTPAHAARLYVLAEPASEDPLRGVLTAASTRVGRLALRRALIARASQPRSSAPSHQGSRSGPRRLAAREADTDQSHSA